MINKDPGLQPSGDEFGSQAQAFVEQVSELSEQPLSEQDRIIDVVEMLLEDMDHRLADEPPETAYYTGMDVCLNGELERLILVRGEKCADGVRTVLDWFSDPRMIADLKQNAQ